MRSRGRAPPTLVWARLADHLLPTEDGVVAAAKDPFEAEAKRILERLVGGSAIDRDVPPAQGLRDFDLIDQGGTVTDAVEVTSVQLPAARATRSGIEQLRKLDLGLQQSWSITVHETAAIAPIRKSAPAQLNQLTALGVDQFDAIREPDEPSVQAIVGQLAALRVVGGRTLPRLTPPRLIASVYGSGALDTSNLTIAVEAELGKPDNRRKLAAAPSCAIRHLFVWLHDSHWYVSSLMRGDFPWPPAPLLPEEVDVAWVAIADGSPPVCSAIMRVDDVGIGALDPTTGQPLPLPPMPVVDGPPGSPPDCPVCGQPGQWTVERRRRWPLGGGRPDVVDAWAGSCSVDEAHYAFPGRGLSRRERHERGL